MAIGHLPHSEEVPANSVFEVPERRTAASYERELTDHRHTESQLRAALAREVASLHEEDEVIEQLELLSRECDHRILNELQMIVSLLSLQSWASTNAETSSQLAAAADRITTIGRIHRRLHYFDGVQTVAFKQFIEDLCRDFSTILSSEERPKRTIVIEAVDDSLRGVTAIPLGFIVNELITNAIKYGKGAITIRLEPNPGKGYALSVSNDGPALPEGFDPAACKGLGMRIIRSFVERIGGELRIDRIDNNQGTRFTVLFS
jgi:two-component system, sensor histidine kinase PdtaS